MTDSAVHRELRPIYSEVDEAVRDIESAIRKANRLRLSDTEDELKAALARIRGIRNEIEACQEPEFARFRNALGERAKGEQEGK